jgi:cobalt/nickel transport system permease protein
VQPAAGIAERDEPLRHDLLSPYQHGTSPVHRLPATAKLVGALGFVLVVALVRGPAWGVYAIAAGALTAYAAISRVAPGTLLTRLLLVEPFAIGVALLSLLQPGGAMVFLTLLSRSTLCLFCFVLVSATTRFSDLLAALLALRVPRLLVTSLALTHRYLFVLIEESGRMRRARASRTFTRGRWLDWRLSATVIAQLFIRSSERAERIYAAMCARGWTHDGA